MNSRFYKIFSLAAIAFVITALLVGCTKTVYVPYNPPPAQAPTTVYVPPTTVYVPPTTTTVSQTTTSTQRTIWTANPNQIIPYGNWASPATGIYVSSGQTLTLSWSADGIMDVFIFTESQYLNFKPIGLLSGYIAHDAKSQGTITASIQNSDTYYVVVRNQQSLGSIKLYQAILTAQ